MPLYICVKDKPRRRGDRFFYPALIRTVPCEDVGDGEKTLLDLWVDSPSPGFQNFKSALGEAWKDPTRRERVKKVICDIHSLYEPERGSEEYILHVAFAEALIAFLEADPLLCDEFVKSYRALYRKARCELVLITAPTLDRFTLHFKVKDKNEELIVDAIALGDEKRLPTEYYNILKKLAQDDEDLRRLRLITHSFLSFARGVEPASHEAKHLCAFAKALLDFASDTRGSLLAEMLSRADLRPGIYEFIFINESSIEQRKTYLDKFVASEEDYVTQQRTFDNIIRGLKREQADLAVVREAAVLIAEYYLKVYDLANAAKVLKDAQSQERRGNSVSGDFRAPHGKSHNHPASVNECLARLLLKMASSMYSKTSHWVAGFGMLLLALLGPALLRAYLVPATSPLHQLLGWASLGVLALFYLGTILLPAVVLYKSRRDKLPYFQLFFPRLLGATVVGFMPLVFDTTPWQIGSDSGWLTIILIGALAYLASVVYLHLDAHKMLATIRSSEWKSILRAASQLFWIGLMQSVTIAVVVSTLLSPVVWRRGMRGIMLDCSVGSVGIYPTLIFLWAGIALFIGAFAQLLWQARRITEPL